MVSAFYNTRVIYASLLIFIYTGSDLFVTIKMYEPPPDVYDLAVCRLYDRYDHFDDLARDWHRSRQIRLGTSAG